MKIVSFLNIVFLSLIFGCFSVYGAEYQKSDCETTKIELLDSQVPDAAKKAAEDVKMVPLFDYDPEQLRVETPIVLYRSDKDDILCYEFPVSLDGSIVAVSDVIMSDDDQYSGGIVYDQGAGESFAADLMNFLNEVDYVHDSEYIFSCVSGEENHFTAYSPTAVYDVNNYTISESENTEEAYTAMVETIAAAMDAMEPVHTLTEEERAKAAEIPEGAVASSADTDTVSEGLSETESITDKDESEIAISEAAAESSEPAESAEDTGDSEAVSHESHTAPLTVGIVIAIAAVGAVLVLRKRK